MPRFAAIDVGTNSVLLLVAERDAAGRFEAVLEKAEITRLGRGVDATRTLAAEAIEETASAVAAFAALAKEHGATQLAISATSAARDASNGAAFLDEVRRRTGVAVRILSGDDEARLSFASVKADFGGTAPLVVIDIGGGSTEFIFGDASGAVTFRRSFDVGSVRLTERHLRGDPPSDEELAAVRAATRAALADLPQPPAGFRLVGVAGTVTTVCAIARRIDPYDAAVVHGNELTVEEVEATTARLAQLPLLLRRTIPGLQPRRADVIVAGACILHEGLLRLGASSVTVSDRGLRWGLLVDTFGHGG